MTGTGKDGAIDAWAQPVLRRVRERLPEVARLFENSGSADMLDRRLGLAYPPRYYPPQLALDTCLTQVAELDLPDAARAAFLHGNARRVPRL